MRMLSCAATLCFIPGIVISTNVGGTPPLAELKIVQRVVADYPHSVIISPIKISSYQPSRYLTPVEQKVMKRALLRSVMVIDQGHLSA